MGATGDDEADHDPSPQGRVAAQRPGGVRRGRPLSSVSVQVARDLRQRMTPQEVKLWNWLRETIEPTGFHFRRQVPIGGYVADFACLKSRVIVEIDGGQHGTEEGRARDAARDCDLKRKGFVVLRFWNHQVDREKEILLDTIRVALEASRYH